MHIDHSKLVELIVDASGIDKEKVEAQFAELISEINQAVNDGEAYEVEGFGIFSGIGNRLIFIPSKELETEINFKYVGMEPIEMDESSIASEPADAEDEDDAVDDDPFADLQTPEKEEGEEAEADRYGSSAGNDPFSGLVEELDDEEIPEEKREEYKSMLDLQEDESDDDDVFGFGDEEDDTTPEPEAADEESSIEEEIVEEDTTPEPEEPVEEEDPFGEDLETVVSYDDEEESMEEEFSLDEPVSEESEEEDEDEEEEAPGPDQWGIESHKEGESASNLFASLMGELPDDEDEKPSAQPAGESDEDDPSFDEVLGDEGAQAKGDEEDAIQQSLSEVSKRLEDLMAEREKALEPDPEPEPEPEPEEPVMSEPEEEISEKVLPESLASQFEEEDDEDFDDPFKEFAEDDDEDEPVSEKEDAMPVITNTASALREQPAEEKKEKKPVKEKKLKPKKMKQRSKSSPAFLWVLLIMVILAGGILGAGYFGLISVPGVTPQSSNNNIAANTPPVQQTPTPEPEPVQQVTEQQPAEQQPVATEPEPEPEPAPQEQVTETPVSITGTGEAPQNQAAYGLRGTATEEANDGYTIVLYSLSVRENAYAEQRSLAEDGYRAVVVPLPSSRYGTLWRVSIGQFATLQDAAIAAEGLGDTFTQDYFIKKITN